MRTEELDEQINKALSGWDTPSKRGKKAIWQSITNTIGTKQKRLISFEKWHWVAAASLVAVLVSYAIFYSAQVNYITNTNEQLTISLPDGSTIKLNSESEASFNTISWTFSRSVSLAGEGFFQVNKGSQFSVHTKNGIIKVLGTSFSVLSRNSNFLVECYTGKVEIDNSIDKHTITKGERVVQAHNQALTKEQINQSNQFPSWLEGHYTYSKNVLAHVFNDIEKQYDISITMTKAMDEMEFTGEWDATMPLEDVLKIVCMPFNLEAITISEKEIKIQKVEM